MSVFNRFATRLQDAIVHRLGFRSLRPVQDEAGAALLDGKNAVILAPTAGGKTEASMFPMLSMLVDDEPDSVGVLYIAPIKALLNNQAERLGTYTQMVGLDRFVWHGDTGASARKKFLADPCALLMTTPESLEVMLVSQKVDAKAIFGALRAVVIDEIHALAGSDRGAHLLSVIERLTALSTHDVQRVGLSATVGNPTAILSWIQGTSKREGVVVNPPSKPARRQLLVLHHEELGPIADDAARMARGHKSLFFCESRAITEVLADRLQARGIPVFVHHSAVSKEERQHAEAQFHQGSEACIVCTSTLELGIDVGDLDKVLQAEAPTTVSAFMQRMGRTGRRAGQVANTAFFCTSPETVLQAAALIQLARTRWVEAVELSARCWPVLVHQLFAMALAEGGVREATVWAHLSQLPDFKGITGAEFRRCVDWMVGRSALDRVDGLLVLGHAAERRFGRRNFMDLYAVFSSPQSYKVLGPGKAPVGSLQQDFVDRLVEDASSFLLGGRPWRVTGIDHSRREIKVVPAASGAQPSWSGYLPQYLSFEICQQIQALIDDDALPGWLHSTARTAVIEQREALDDAGVRRAAHPRLAPADTDTGLHWWTFAGGRINNTLRYALRACKPEWTVVPSNLELRVSGEGVNLNTLRELIEQIRDVEFWEDPKLWREVAEDLPNYRLSKFQQFMPPWVVREMVAGFLLDIEGAARWLMGQHVAAPDWSGTEKSVDATPRPEARQTQPRQTPAVPDAAEPSNPVIWVDTQEGLQAACETLSQADRIGLDVETTLYDQALCLVQMANETHTWLIDPLAIDDLAPLAELMANESVVKVIHNASFEKRVLKRQGMRIVNITDTLKVSRAVRNVRGRGTHTLAAVCRREMDVGIDKECQTSDWRRRPLTADQVRYAALDAEILLRVLDALPEPPQGTLFG